jgi:tetraacyldisaccharide 4'-kinase
MKAPKFWYKPPGVEALLLWPASLLWRLGAFVRRLLAPSPYRAKIPLICVGNAVVGGAGKTPTALAIAHILQQAGKKPVFAARGYGGNIRGPVSVDLDRHSALDVGDEALLLAGSAPTFIGHDRVAAVQEAEKHGTHVVLDDGLQNPHLRAELAFVVIDGETGLGNGFMMPAGPMRESFHDAMSRASAAIIIGERDMHNVGARIHKPTLRAHWQANLPDDFPRGEEFFAFSGIGRPEKFYKTCRAAGLTLVATEDFPDHYYFSDTDLARLTGKAMSLKARLLTTEKDWVRLPHNLRAKITAFPVKLTFEDEAMLKRMLKI